MALPLIELLSLGSSLISRIFPSQEEKDKANLALLQMVQQGELTELTAKSEIVKTEAASSHWLAANWRPLLMLTFGGLIVARWFGFTAPNLSEAEYLKLWDIVHLGIGGYVVGRSAEKIVPMVASTFKK